MSAPLRHERVIRTADALNVRTGLRGSLRPGTATGNRSKVVTVSGKDRRAILLAGKTGTAYMYMDRSGNFASSFLTGEFGLLDTLKKIHRGVRSASRLSSLAAGPMESTSRVECTI